MGKFAGESGSSRSMFIVRQFAVAMVSGGGAQAPNERKTGHLEDC